MLMGFCNLASHPLRSWGCPAEDRSGLAAMLRLDTYLHWDWSQQSGRHRTTLEIRKHPEACQVTRTKHTSVIRKMMSLVPLPPAVKTARCCSCSCPFVFSTSALSPLTAFHNSPLLISVRIIQSDRLFAVRKSFIERSQLSYSSLCI